MKTRASICVSLLLLSISVHSIDLDSLLIKSVGGQKALDRIKSLKSYRMTGKMNWNGLEGAYEGLFKAPNKIKATANFGTFSIEQGFDSVNAWQKDIHGRIFDLAGFEKTEFMRSVYFMSFAYVVPGSFSGDAEFYGTVDYDNSSFYKVELYPFLNDTVAALFDLANGMQTIQIARLDSLSVITELGDYKNIDDVLIPFHSKSTAENTPMLTEITLDSVAFDIAVDDAQFKKPDVQLNDFHFPADSTSVTIPFRFSNGHVMVYVEVNGIKKGWFILDTGASATYYDATFVRDMELDYVGEIPSMGLGGFQQMQLVRMDSLNIGQLTMYNQTAGVIPLDQLRDQAQKKAPFGGLLGYDFFMRFPMLFDFQKQELTVFNPAKFALPENGVTHPFHLCMMIPTVTAEINGTTGDFLIDLGNSFGLIIHKKFGEQLTRLSTIDTGRVIERNLTGVGQSVSGREIRLESLQINAHKIMIPEAILAESSYGLTGSWEIAGNIGTKVLEQFRVLIDYPNSRIVFYDLEESLSK